jgi:hypothetical protein
LEVGLRRFEVSQHQDRCIREWVEREGQPLATRKGATLPLDALAGAAEALTRASRSIDASGATGALAAVK